MIGPRLALVPEFCRLQAKPSGDVKTVPLSPTATKRPFPYTTLKRGFVWESEFRWCQMANGSASVIQCNKAQSAPAKLNLTNGLEFISSVRYAEILGFTKPNGSASKSLAWLYWTRTLRPR